MISRNLIRSVCLPALVFLLCLSSLPAQNFRNFSSLTGKKDMAATCVIQGEDGTLFVGTPSGLVMYDGNSFKVFSKENGLADNSISVLFLQKDRTLWIGHKNGKVTLYKDKKFSPFPANEDLPDEPVSAFTEANGMWIASYGGGLSFYSHNKLTKYTSDNGLSDNFVYTLCADSKNGVWAGTDAGVAHIDMKTGSPVFSVISMKEGLPDNIVRSIACDSHDRLYLAMQDSGICSYEAAGNKFRRIVVASNWRFGTINSLHIDKTGALLIATKQRGVIRYAVNGEEKEALTIFDSRNGLLSNEVNNVFSDRENNTWLSTAKGLSEISQGRVTYLNAENGLPSDKVLTLYVDKKDNCWISTDMGLIKYSFLPDGRTEIKNYSLTEGMLEKQTTSIYEDKTGALWFGTYGVGLYRLDPATQKEENISVKQGLANDNISSISSDSKGDIWVSTLGGGISCIHYDKGTRTIKNYTSENGLPVDYIYFVFADSKDNLWIGTDGKGVALLREGVFVNVPAADKLKDKTIYSITEDKGGNIWFNVSEEGIYKYDGKSFVNYSISNGLRDNNPSILTTYNNKIITVHPKGIDMLDVQTGKIKTFSVSENDIEPNLNGCFTDKEGNVWIGTSAGALKFRSTEQAYDTITPVVRFNSLMVQYQLFSMDSTNQFSYRQNNFIFNFSAVWLRSDDKVKLRFKLEGADSSYFETESNVASYSNLPPGNYTFLVCATNSEGKWSTPVSYAFTITTPFWQRIWFWVIALFLTIVLLYLFIQYRFRALQKEKHLLENKVQERTTEIVQQAKVIEAKNKELERLSIVASETGNVIIIMDANGRLEWVNNSFEKLNRITLDELRKLKGETIYDISNNPEIRNIINKCVREKNSVVYESKNSVNEKVVWESSTLTPIYNEAGELHKLIIIDTDVTERKRDEEIIRQKNKDITDSIEYAKKIQNSILPDINIIKESLPESFIYFLQKDIVSGDFYWFTRKGDKAVIACVDCTGHGVPGAFMSLIGYNLLNQIVNENDILDPGSILDALNKGVLKALYQNNPNNTSKDGMDIAICTIDLVSNELLFAGAMRPLYLFNKNGFEEIKGDKISIGTKESDREHGIKFTTHSLTVSKDDVFYISSDGYADQFGGTTGKKMMTKNFKKILQEIYQKPSSEQLEMVMKYHNEWKGRFEQVDDILVIGFSIR